MQSFLKSLLISAPLVLPCLVQADGPEEASKAFYRQYAADISTLTSRIESFIADEIVKKKALCEYPPARRYGMRDLDGDRKEDLVVVTIFELANGGNHHESHLFAVLSSRPQEVQHRVVGGRGWREADCFVDGRGSLFLRFRVWAKSDPLCCPSLSSTEEVVIEKGQVILTPFDEIRTKAPSDERKG